MARPLKSLKNGIVYGVLRAAAFGVGWLPVAVACTVGAFLGALAHALAAGERRRAQARIRQAQDGGAIEVPAGPTAITRELARRMGAHLGLLLSAKGVPRHLCRFRPGAREALDAALAGGAGAVVISAHCGNWELLARFLAAEGYGVSTMARAGYDARLTRWVGALREQSGVHSIWREDAGAARQMLRALRQGHLLAFFIDQDTRVEGAFVPFLGRPAHTPTGPAQLALRLGLPMVVVLARTRWQGRLPGLEVVAHPVPVAGLTGEGAEAALTGRCNAIIGAHIAEDPADWMWIHDRWRRQPGGG